MLKCLHVAHKALCAPHNYALIIWTEVCLWKSVYQMVILLCKEYMLTWHSCAVVSDSLKQRYHVGLIYCVFRPHIYNCYYNNSSFYKWVKGDDVEISRLISSHLSRPCFSFFDQFWSMCKMIWQVLSCKQSEKCNKANTNPNLLGALHHKSIEQVMFSMSTFAGGCFSKAFAAKWADCWAVLEHSLV